MKITISRIFETSKFISDLAKVGIGQSASDMMEYLSSFVEQTLRGLRNGLTFEDNVDCLVKTVSLAQGEAQGVELNTPRTPVGAFPIRIVSTTHSLDSFLWYMDNTGKFTVKASFAPVPTERVNITIVVLF